MIRVRPGSTVVDCRRLIGVVSGIIVMTSFSLLMISSSLVVGTSCLMMVSMLSLMVRLILVISSMTETSRSSQVEIIFDQLVLSLLDELMLLIRIRGINRLEGDILYNGRVVVRHDRCILITRLRGMIRQEGERLSRKRLSKISLIEIQVLVWIVLRDECLWEVRCWEASRLVDDVRPSRVGLVSITVLISVSVLILV